MDVEAHAVGTPAIGKDPVVADRAMGAGQQRVAHCHTTQSHLLAIVDEAIALGLKNPAGYRLADRRA